MHASQVDGRRFDVYLGLTIFADPRRVKRHPSIFLTL